MNQKPAIEIKLREKALIEASAGAGKTWTLTAIIVRLLMEGNYRPRQIVATTFTRKAAAEMQRRINERLQNLREVFECSEIVNPDDDLEVYLRQNPPPIGLKAQCEIALLEMNHLFIGTLDSLCQRWLTEYALETGSGERLQLVEDNTLNEVITHDALRHFYCHLAADNLPLLSEYLTKKNPASIAELAQASKNALMDADLDEPPSLIKTQLQLELPSVAEVAKWLDWVRTLPINGNSSFSKRMGKFVAAIEMFSTEKQDELLLEVVTDLFYDSTTRAQKTIFKKEAKSEQLEAFFQHPVTRSLYAMQEYGEQKTTSEAILSAQSLWHSFKNVRDKIGVELDKRGKSSFLFNMKRLNQALIHSDLARYIQHRYPVLLVDESQDLNSEQAFLIEKIYLQNPIENSFLLLVGDPKQAIYRFRGGDVNNYNQLKKHFAATEIYPLLANRRSSLPLIESLNQLYAQAKNPFLGDGIQYLPMTGFDTPRLLTLKDGSPVNNPFYCYKEGNIIDFVEFLLSEQSPYLYDKRPLQAKEIMILAWSNRQLLEFAKELRVRGIECLTHSDTSIFSSEIAADMRLMLQSFLHPFDRAKSNALLCSAFFQYQIHQLATAPNLQNALHQAQQTWRKFGLLAAIHEFMQESDAWKTLSTGANKLENVIFLRALFEIIAKFAPHKQPEVFFNWWLEQLRVLPESDWAKAPPLPQQNAVRLMTIHKAKGLQAPVVLCYLSNGGNRGRLELQRYYQDGRPHLTTFVQNSVTENIIKDEQFNEVLRIFYVALTRAEDLLVTFFAPSAFRKNKKDGDKPTEHLFENAPFFVDWQLPEMRVRNVPTAIDTKQSNAAPSLKTNFYGWYITSFSALASGYMDTAENLNRDENDHSNIETPSNDIRQQFPRGMEAGSFLHEILEHLNPKTPERWNWIITNLLQRYKLEVPDLEALKKWLWEILQTPLGSGLKLGDIRQRSNELSFSLALNGTQLPLQKTSALFKRHGKSISFAPDFKNYRYLRGEIDLVYQHENRFFIADYKSNFLGTNYQQENLEAAMQEHQYHLQAAIYQVALYRRLKMRPNFDFSQLGAVEYLFLRGMNIHGEGIYSWDIPPEFILEFNQLLGGDKT